LSGQFELPQNPVWGAADFFNPPAGDHDPKGPAMNPLLKKILDHKIAWSSVLVLAVFVSFGVILSKGLHSLGLLTRTLYEHPLVVSNASLQAALNIIKMHERMEDAIAADAPVDIAVSLNIADEAESDVYQELYTIQANILGAEGQALAKQAWQLFSDWTLVRQEAIRLRKSGNKQAALLLVQGKGAAHIEKLENKVLEITSYARNKATFFMEQSAASQSRFTNIVRLAVAAVILSVLGAFFTVNRVLKANKVISDERSKLQKAMEEIKTLRGIVPVCSSCNKIRDDKGLWTHMEAYIREHTEADFSRGLCPDCQKKFRLDTYKKTCDK
jgi:cell division protein FtsB